MATEIEKDAFLILGVLASQPREDSDLSGKALLNATGISADAINDAVEILVGRRWAKKGQGLGTAPFNCGWVQITSTGRLRNQQSLKLPGGTSQKRRIASEKPIPEKASTSIRLFISHSSHDLALVKRLVDFLQHALHLRA